MGKRILIADDSSTIRKIVELTFRESEIEVEAVGSGRDALERLERTEADLVLADVEMPGPSGYEICRTIKTSARPVPVLLLAGTFEPFDIERARECGADDYLVKPFESGQLRAKVEALLGGAEQPRSAAQADPSDETAVEVVEPAGAAELPPGLVDAVTREVLGRLSDDVIREMAEGIVSDVAERILRERIDEIEDEGGGTD